MVRCCMSRGRARATLKGRTSRSTSSLPALLAPCLALPLVRIPSSSIAALAPVLAAAPPASAPKCAASTAMRSSAAHASPRSRAWAPGSPCAPKTSSPNLCQSAHELAGGAPCEVRSGVRASWEGPAAAAWMGAPKAGEGRRWCPGSARSRSRCGSSRISLGDEAGTAKRARKHRTEPVLLAHPGRSVPCSDGRRVQGRLLRGRNAPAEDASSESSEVLCHPARQARVISPPFA